MIVVHKCSKKCISTVKPGCRYQYINIRCNHKNPESRSQATCSSLLTTFSVKAFRMLMSPVPQLVEDINVTLSLSPTCSQAFPTQAFVWGRPGMRLLPPLVVDLRLVQCDCLVTPKQPLRYLYLSLHANQISVILALVPQPRFYPLLWPLTLISYNGR